MAQIETLLKASPSSIPSGGSYSELGQTGLKNHTGIVNEDYYKDLNFPQAAKTFKKMSYDSTIASAITMIKAIARGATWDVHLPEGASDTHANFIKECMADMDRSWGDYFNDWLDGVLTYGYNVNEKVFKKRNGYKHSRSKSSKYSDGRIGWGKLPSRSQATIQRWLWDKSGRELVGVRQNLSGHQGIISERGITKTEINIPVQKFLHFRHNPINDNPEGNSPLKNCYVPWTYKTSIEEYEAVGISRDLAGMPVVSLPPEYMSPTASEEQKAIYEYFKTVVRNITANEQAGLIMPKFIDPDSKKDLFEFELVSSSGAGKSYDTDAILKRYDHRILMTFLADVMILGGDSVGSYSLASSKEAAIIKMVKMLFCQILEVVNRDLIPHTARLNGWGDVVLPEIMLDEVEQDSLDEIGKFVQRVASVGAMEVDKPLSDEMRKLIEVIPADKSKKLDEDLIAGGKSEAGGQSRETAAKDNTSNNKEDAS